MTQFVNTEVVARAWQILGSLVLGVQIILQIVILFLSCALWETYKKKWKKCPKSIQLWLCIRYCTDRLTRGHVRHFDQFLKHRPFGLMLSISQNVRLSVSLSVRLCVCLFTFEVPFNGRFAPTSRSRMSNIFRDLESLGKSNGKKWSNIWIFLFGSGLKLPRKKRFFFASSSQLIHTFKK